MHGLTRKGFLGLGVSLVGSGVLSGLGCGEDEVAATSGGTPGNGSGASGGGTSGGGDGGNSPTAAGGNGGNSNPTSTGGNGGEPGTGGEGGAFAGCNGDIIAKISQNHGHTLTIPLADIIAGAEMTYDATGSSSHCHEVTVTAADFTALKNGEVVVKTSCNGGDHEYVLSCGSIPNGGTPDCDGDPNDPNLGACS